MEGRALDRMARRGWVWMLPTFGLGFGSAGQVLFGADRLPFALAGLVLGAVWQLLVRRDLVARLTVPAVFACIGVGVVLLSREELVTDEPAYSIEGLVLYLGGVLAGLVLTEQYLRRQDRLSGRLSPEAAPATTLGTSSR
ncbi:hypothetical protein QI633_00995 [Nocardioides sp. QY071]|uniref:hypothetical protein n=1 Tax=Nocardioides sp. QY071 TaxID=3044187 RepID=UPI00249AB008|nr:hypothetical protein [Nocardioides sp. QY071]WGY02349.1 hypothetical protein QI633_00995 [Nocardioides sp. QY071]